jgi:hypothetical protein
MSKPASDLERYLAGEFADKSDALTFCEGNREPKAGAGLDFWKGPRALLRFLRSFFIRA